MRFLLLIVLWCSVFAASKDTLADQSLLLLTEENPPFNYLDPESGTVTGPSADLVREIMRRAGVAYEIRLLPWNRAIRLAEEAPDTCVFSMNPTPEREPRFRWLVPFFPGGGIAFFERADGERKKITDASAIRGRVLVAEKALPSIEKLEALPDVIVTKVRQEEDAYDLLLRGRGDYWLAGFFAAADILKDEAKSARIRMVYNWQSAAVGLGCSLKTDERLMQRLREANHAIGDARWDMVARYQ